MNKNINEPSIETILSETEKYASILEHNMYNYEDDKELHEADMEVYKSMDPGIIKFARAKADVDVVIFQCKKDFSTAFKCLVNIRSFRDEGYMGMCRLIISIYHKRLLKKFDKFAILL